ncbi:MAG: hypothetical protein RL177_26 [Bacteroidota bacterium]|jgi:tetratricopeptide (TPR) repeat protein
MKKQTNLFLTLLIGASMMGCSDLLDLEPQASISDDVALSTPGNVQTALVGAYAQLGGADTYGGSYIYLSEIYSAPSDEIYFNGTFIDPFDINGKNIQTTNAYVTRVWTASYNTINRANNVLSALDVFGADAATRARVEGEARFIRGIAYYNLVQAFGKAFNDGNPATNPGVPIILTPTRVVDAALQVQRNTVAEVYAQAIADLNAAKASLPESNGFYADTYAASALLARVHLAKGDYANAAIEANRVIASGNYSLFPSVASNFSRSANGAETIFAMQVTITAGSNDNAVFHAPLPFGRADIQVLDKHMLNYEAGDARASLFTATSRGRMTSKYTSTTGDSRRFNINVVRLAEMYLTRAEANFRTGGTLGATPLADVNMIRARVGLADLASVTLADILKERRNELIFEGVLRMDMRRNQVASSIAGAALAWNDNKLTFPVPDRECNVNGNLVQNPGYGVGKCAP